MEIGNEIGQKIRSAIKAKLVDLGAYVDDELPDYIMVMVANKKTQIQMSEDLSLFLGANTAKFTTWLHGLLEKLQSITTDAAVMKSERQSQAVNDSIVDKSSLSASTDRKSSGSVDKKTVKETEVERGSSNEYADKKKVRDGKEFGSDGSGLTKSRSSEMVKKIPVLEEEPVIRLQFDHDEFEEESEKVGDWRHSAVSERRTSVAAGDAAVEPRDSRTNRSLSDKLLLKRSHDEEYVPQSYVGHMRKADHSVMSSHSRITQTRHSDGIQSHVQRRTEGVVDEKVVERRRSSGLESLIGAVLSHTEDDDEYDPCRPAIGNVASIIKVTERKSSIPLALQANKSLLLKAMQQAEQSVANIRRRAGTDESTFPTDKEPGGSMQRLTIRQRLGHSNSDTLVGRSRSRSAERKNIRVVAACGKHRTATYCSIPQEQRAGVAYRVAPHETKYADDMPSRMVPHETNYADDVFIDDVRLTSETSAEYDIDDRRYVHYGQRPDDDDNGRVIKKPRLSDIVQSHGVDGLEVVGEELVELRKGSAPTPPASEEHVSGGVGNMVRGGVVNVSNDDDNDDDDDDDDDDEELEQLRMILMQQKKQNMLDKKKKRKMNTKFVVTLDNAYSGGSLNDWLTCAEGADGGVGNVVDLTMEPPLQASTVTEEPQRNIVRVKPQPLSHQPSVEQSNVLQSQCGQEAAIKTDGNGIQKSLEKCRFWPICKNGDACQFYHPSVQCRTFPICKFGDKCLYIHPTCKFDGKCTKLNCPYTHVASRVIQPARVTISVQHATGRSNKSIKCNYYPNCSDATCPYQHPKLCRYGAGCLNKISCPFSHPKLPPSSQFKWAAGQ